MLLHRGFVAVVLTATFAATITESGGLERKLLSRKEHKTSDISKSTNSIRRGDVQPIKQGKESQEGLILERWDGIDSYLVNTMISNPRFPNFPNYRTIVKTFSEPVNWGDKYGSRIRGFFVPLQDGPHVFMIASDAEGQLFLSKDGNPDGKALIARVRKSHETKPLEFDRYSEQKSWPVTLRKGQYYYMEALHKEQYGDDSLAIAVVTPDNKIYKPIPAQFLRTKNPNEVPEPHYNDVLNHCDVYGSNPQGWSSLEADPLPRWKTGEVGIGRGFIATSNTDLYTLS